MFSLHVSNPAKDLMYLCLNFQHLIFKRVLSIHQMLAKCPRYLVREKSEAWVTNVLMLTLFQCTHVDSAWIPAGSACGSARLCIRGEGHGRPIANRGAHNPRVCDAAHHLFQSPIPIPTRVKFVALATSSYIPIHK